MNESREQSIKEIVKTLDDLSDENIEKATLILMGMSAVAKAQAERQSESA